MSASTQNLALAALLFPYRDLLERELDGSGLRLMEALRLPVTDLDIERQELAGARRQGRQGASDPAAVEHGFGLSAGWGCVLMPYALERK